MQITDPRTGADVILRNSGDYWTELGVQKTCDHTPSEVRRWTNRNGGTAACRQCTTCGVRVGNPVGGIAHDRLPAADEDIALTWEANTKAACRAITIKHIDREARESESWWADYNVYLQTDAWRARRELVLKRCGGVCEGCGAAAATEVHHMTYEHVMEEFLFELKGLCGPCHTRWHATER